MKPTLEDVIITFINWSVGNNRKNVMKLVTALIFHYYKKNEIYESSDSVANETGTIEINVRVFPPKPKLSLVKTDKE